MMRLADYPSNVYEGDQYGLSIWQVFAVAAFTAAVFVLLDRGWDLLGEWWDRRAEEPIEDAADDPEATKDEPYVGKPTTPYSWPVTDTDMVHRTDCRHAVSTTGWFGTHTAEQGPVRAAELGLRPAKCCRPFEVAEAVSGSGR